MGGDIAEQVIALIRPETRRAIREAIAVHSEARADAHRFCVLVEIDRQLDHRRIVVKSRSELCLAYRGQGPRLDEMADELERPRELGKVHVILYLRAAEGRPDAALCRQVELVPVP